MAASHRLLTLWVSACAGTTLLIGAPAYAQPFPSKPVRIIVPFPPGGGVDVVAHVIGRRLSDTLGQPVVVENRGGASATLGTDVVAKSPPDGHTRSCFGVDQRPTRRWAKQTALALYSALDSPESAAIA